MSEERERIDLRRLRLGRPDPALKTRTLAQVRAALADAEPVGAWRWREWREWRLEAALAAGIAACVLLLAALGRPPADLRPPAPAPAAASADEALVDRLGLDDLKPYILLRRAIARRLPEPEGRYPYNEQLRDFHFDECC